MMKRLFKKWLPLSVSILILAMAIRSIVLACGGGDWDDVLSSNIAPEAFVDERYSPFFFSEDSWFYGGYDTEHKRRSSEDNVSEWTGYVGGDDKMRGFVNYMLNFDNQNTVDSVLAYAMKRTAKLPVLPPEIIESIDMALLRKGKTVDFLKYAAVAHRTEAFALRDYYYYSWEEQPPLPEVQELDNIEQKLLVGFQSAPAKSFLKQRYWFQLVRYYFFYNRDKAISLFHEYAGSFTQNHIYYRTMAYAAGAYYKQQQYGKSNYYYSLVFAGDDDLKTVAHWSFHPQEEADWQQTLALCKSTEEKITCWQMLGTFYKDELRSMKEIYQLEPSSNKLDLLLSRLINKMESESNVYRFEDSLAAKDYLQDAFLWIKQKTDEGKISNKFLWNAGVGYLAFLKEDYATARAYYTKAEKYKPETKLANQQLRLLNLLVSIDELDKITAADEARLMPELKWLLVDLSRLADYELRYNNAIDWVKQSLAKRYDVQGDIAKAECYVHNTAYYGNEQHVETIREFLHKNHPESSYEYFCRSLSNISVADIDEMKAIKAAHSDDISTAIALMRSLNYSTTELLGNPFNGGIQDCNDCDHAAPQRVKYTKLSFLEKVQEMENKIKDKDDVYNNALLLGNAFYNMSFFGNARIFSECDIIYIGHEPTTIHAAFMPMMVDNSEAEKYYTLALQHAKTDEQKAKCTYMLAKCERNNWYTHLLYDKGRDGFSQDDLEKLVPQIQRNWFGELNKYKRTNYYKEVLEECGYFRNYVKK